MNKTRTGLLWVGIAVLALVAGIGLRTFLVSDREQGLRELRQLVLPDADGHAQPLAQWHGKVVVVNFWATWCDPCREEVPALVRAQDKMSGKGVQIVGIGIDSPTKIRQFAAEYRVNYPLVVAGFDVIEIARKLGNRAGGLPYTVVLDREGRFAASHLGKLDEQRLDEILRPWLAS
jgi:thiol-disulfide isomerase/thioredoxin